MALRPGTPSEYLQRLALHNQVFGDDYRYEGIVSKGDGKFDLVVSQPVIKADSSGPKPTAAEIERYFVARGFEPVAGQEGKTYYRASDNLAVFDAHEGNLIRTAGGVLPIDVVPVHPDDRLLAALERGL